ncbi:MAG: O-antigen ligase family protein [Flavobacteriales bacterium]|jgi:O-antigen ligase|nr:O-antigen ligase family protein [Flavobacteriales bacterium]MBK7247692.1 O-antigen ligase family protein [Flavobacteriales bacterium]MBK9597057.1 O-antigen ligase family protein [Flavobacteriales bacterium]QQS72968.1 MAG: O-antigen ligase family protein [Flavobacteriales bacterium]HQV39969.1 O-antigen ligase family protein [Flavobacteriales bacterium]
MEKPEAAHRGMAGRALEVAAVGIAIALPLWPALLPPLVALLLCCVIWARVTHRSVPGKLTVRSPLFWSALLYGAHVLGLLWSMNMDFAGLDLGIKASLVLFALIAVVGVPQFRSDRPKLAFIGGNAIAVVICVVRAGYRSADLYLHPDPAGTLTNYALSVPFFASDFSTFLHPSYMAMYLTLALMLLARPLGQRTGGKRLRMATALLLVLGIVLCASKAGWIILVLAAIAVLAERWSDRWMRIIVGWGFLAVLLAGITLYFTTDYVHERVGQVLNTFQGSQLQSDAANSTDDRRLVWRTSIAVVAAHPWSGVGTGDVKDELLKTYAKRGYVEPLKKKLNAHDQYLNTGVALGLGGMLLLVLMVIVPTVYAFGQGDVMLASFLLLNALNWTVESMLEVQAGTIFFAFFAWLLTLDPSRTLRSTD